MSDDQFSEYDSNSSPTSFSTHIKKKEPEKLEVPLGQSIPGSKDESPYFYINQEHYCVGKPRRKKLNGRVIHHAEEKDGNSE